MTIDLKLMNGWQNYGGTYARARARKIGDTVFLEGLIKHGSSNGASTFTVLPEGFRPKSGRRIFAGCQNGNAFAARIDIEINGNVNVQHKPATHRWVPLDNIVFRL